MRFSQSSTGFLAFIFLAISLAGPMNAVAADRATQPSGIKSIMKSISEATKEASEVPPSIQKKEAPKQVSNVAGAAATQALPQKNEAPMISSDYIIGPEDVLEISVWKNQDLSKTVTVRPDGMISLPLIGDVRASGRTPSELRADIVAKLKQYQENAVASVIVQTVNSYKIFILGEVMAPGSYQLKQQTTLVQAVALAGGFNQFASKKIILLRQKNDGKGGVERTRIYFDDIVYKDTSAITLQAGDTIFVP